MNPFDLKPQDVAPAFPGAMLADIGLYLPHVISALRDARLEAPRIVAYALATIAAETAGFRPISEGVSQFNTDNRARPFGRYDGRKSLGNMHPGDGARFRGRGFVQLTGRFNYNKYGERIGVDLLNSPEAANHASVAAQILAVFIADREFAILEALGNHHLATARRLVNGGTHGLERFTAAYNTMIEVLKK